MAVATDKGCDIGCKTDNSNVSAEVNSSIAGTNSFNLTVTGNKSGNSIITVYDKNNPSLNCAIMVTISPNWSISLTQSVPITVKNYYFNLKNEITIDSIEMISQTDSQATFEVKGFVSYTNDDPQNYYPYRIYDSEGYQISAGSIWPKGVTSIGDKFKTTFNVSINNPSGEYSLEFYDEIEGYDF